jgi:TP901 family phage tail tape measure protein
VGAESFTVLAILEARDQASEIFAKVDESLDKFSGTAKEAADSARVAGDSIDESLTKTASGADALDIADARVSAAQERLATATREQAAAERDLLEAQAKAAESGDVDAAAADRQVTAADRLSSAQGRATAASRQLSDAQKVQADTAAASAAKNDEAAAGEKKVSDASAESGAKLGALSRVAGMTALGLGVAGAVMVKAAGNFQDSTTHLVTDAGESAKNLQMVQAGILQVSTATGTSASDITNAMYHIESGGYHGAAGLNMLKIAAQGARVGGADLDTVSKTLVGTMNAYGLSAGHSASFMNQLIATVGAGDMRMQDLASSMSAVTPLAAAAHIQFSQVGGAIATMTAQGMSAQQATQDLANTIRSLQNPNSVAVGEMNQMGLASNKVAQQLGQKGLTGTLGELTQAITKHMGPSGQIIMNAFNQSKYAAQDAQIMFAHLGGQAQQLAKQYETGAIGAKTYRTEAQALGGTQGNLAAQFETTYNKSKSFNSLLTSGQPGVQTYTAALAKMMGGATGLNTALMLSGGHMGTFEKNVATVAAASKHAGDNVNNWSTIQGTFNFKLQSAKTAVENTGIAIGSALLPAATSLLKTISGILEPVAEWTAKHRTLTEILFGGVIALAATIAIVGVAAKTYKAITGTLDTVKKALQLVGLVSKETAATQETSAAQAATAQATAAEESALAEETAAAESSSSWIVAAASTVGAWIAAGASMVANAAVWVAGNVAKVAVVVAGNIAGALVTAAAWVAANAVMLLGIGLIVIAVIAAVVLIVKYWSKISDAAKTVFHDVLAVIDSVISWVKGHWPLLLGILTGPFGLAVGEIAQHWAEIRSGAQRVVSDVAGFFGRLPGMILSGLADLDAWMYNAGLHAMEKLAQGILGAVSYVGSVVSSVASKVAGFFGLSPAKEGPLSGSGAPEIRGAHFAAALAQGMRSGGPGVASSAGYLAAAVSGGNRPGQGLTAGLAGGGLSALPGSGGGGAGGVTLNLDLRGSQVMSDRDMNQLVNKIGTAVATKIGPQAGLRFRMG